jgi:hypothetical protein
MSVTSSAVRRSAARSDSIPVVGGDRLRDILQQHRLPVRGGATIKALTLANRCRCIDDPRR